MADKKISEFSNLSTISDNDVCLVNSNNATFKTTFGTIKNFIKASIPTGVKGGAESSYRTGNVNITKANIGLGNVNNTADEDKFVAGLRDDRDSQRFTRTDLTFGDPVELPDGEGWYYPNPRSRSFYPCVCLSDWGGTSIGAFDIEQVLATTSKAGFMSAADKTKLDNADNFTTIRKLTNSNYDCNDYHGDNASGIYYVGAGVVNSPQDYCGMLVTSRESNTGFCAQIAVGNKGIYYRLFWGAPPAWTSWYKVTGTAMS